MFTISLVVSPNEVLTSVVYTVVGAATVVRLTTVVGERDCVELEDWLSDKLLDWSELKGSRDRWIPITPTEISTMIATEITVSTTDLCMISAPLARQR